MIALRPYQLNSVARIIAAIDPLVVAPTGSGKTVIMSEVIKRAQNKFVLVVAHRRQLIFQTRDKLAEFNVTAGVILASEPMNQMARVQVASIQTFPFALHPRKQRSTAGRHRLRRRGAPRPRPHLPRDPRRLSQRQAHWSDSHARPTRRSNIGSTYSTMVECPQIEDLIELKHLVPTTVYAPTVPDLKGVPHSARRLHRSSARAGHGSRPAHRRHR